MEKEMVLGNYRLLVDIEKTRAYYEARPLPWVTCACAGCRNFVKAAKLLPPAVTDFFAALGADPEKPAETCWYPGAKTEANGGAWYHICGEILARAEPPEKQLFGEWLDIAEKFGAAFRPDCHILPEDFPRPCFQLDVSFRLPWTLEEENPEVARDEI